MGFWSGLGKVLGVAGAGIAAPFTGGTSLSALPAILGAGGAALGALGQSAATNRGAAAAGQMDLAQLLMQRDQNFFNQQAGNQKTNFDQQLATAQEGRTSASDAWKKLLATQHVLSPTPMPQLSPYQAPMRQATGAERQGAQALSSEVLARLLQGGPSVQAGSLPTPVQTNLGVDPSLFKPGKLETFANIASPLSTILGRLTSQPKSLGYPDMTGAGSFGGTRG